VAFRAQSVAACRGRGAFRVPPVAVRIRAVAFRVRTVAIRIRAVAIRIRAVAIRVRAVAIRIRAVAIRVRAVAIRIRAVAIRIRTVAIRIRAAAGHRAREQGHAVADAFAILREALRQPRKAADDRTSAAGRVGGEISCRPCFSRERRLPTLNQPPPASTVGGGFLFRLILPPKP